MFQKQPIMRKVLYALAPLYLFSLYQYGWRVITISLVVFPLGIGAEYLMEKLLKKKAKTQVTEAALVTSALYVLAMPPAVPLWIAGLGIIFAIVFGKEVYGGFGRNIFNPAITGRLFIYITFPAALGTGWLVSGFSGRWTSFAGTASSADAVTGATALDLLRDGGSPAWTDLFLGFQSGSLGEASFVLILLAAIYLIWTKTASWRLIVSTFFSAFLLMAALYYLPELLGFEPLANRIHPVLGSMSGSLAFVAVFMATDPVSGPKKLRAQWAYGLLIGTVTVLIRIFSGFPEGTSFAILFGNTFASLLDEVLGGPNAGQAKKKATGKAPAKAPAKPVEASAAPSQEAQA